MEKKEFTFGGVTDSQFDEAVKTVCSYFDGIAAAPINEETESAIILAGLQGLVLSLTQKAFHVKLKELYDVREKRNSKESSEK